MAGARQSMRLLQLLLSLGQICIGRGQTCVGFCNTDGPRQHPTEALLCFCNSNCTGFGDCCPGYETDCSTQTTVPTTISSSAASSSSVCTDAQNCESIPDSICQSDESVRIACPNRCGVCGVEQTTATPTASQPTVAPTITGYCSVLGCEVSETTTFNGTTCFCENGCQDFNDCCPDYNSFCIAPYTGAPTSGSPTGNPTGPPSTSAPVTPTTTQPTSAPSEIPTALPTKNPSTVSPTVFPTREDCQDAYFVNGTNFCKRSHCVPNDNSLQAQVYRSQLCRATCDNCTVAPTLVPTLPPSTIQPTAFPTSSAPTPAPTPRCEDQFPPFCSSLLPGSCEAPRIKSMCRGTCDVCEIPSEIEYFNCSAEDCLNSAVGPCVVPRAGSCIATDESSGTCPTNTHSCSVRTEDGRIVLCAGQTRDGSGVFFREGRSCSVAPFYNSHILSFEASLSPEHASDEPWCIYIVRPGALDEAIGSRMIAAPTSRASCPDPLNSDHTVHLIFLPSTPGRFGSELTFPACLDLAGGVVPAVSTQCLGASQRVYLYNTCRKQGYNTNFQGTCSDMNECNFGACGAIGTCTSNDGSFLCSCPSSTSYDETTGTCSPGCSVGLRWNGAACDNVNECTMHDMNNCADVGSDCTDIEGSFQCSCALGYTGDGITCTPAPCDVDGVCRTNEICSVTSNGSAVCECEVGYGPVVGESGCADVNECHSGNSTCDPAATCSNSDGSFTCDCNEGWLGNGERCDDVNECTNINACGEVGSICLNTNGSFQCNCDRGYESDEFGACVNIYECDNSPCDSSAVCDDTIGSFECRCIAGYTGDGIRCRAVNECLEGLHSCLRQSDCIDETVGYSCACPRGQRWISSTLTCVEENECQNDPEPCHPEAFCTDIVGSFTCECNSGYVGDGTNCFTPQPSTSIPSAAPTRVPTSSSPSDSPSMRPTSSSPTNIPSEMPTASLPTNIPTLFPSAVPTTTIPTRNPTSSIPTAFPSEVPSSTPTGAPSFSPTRECHHRGTIHCGDTVTGNTKTECNSNMFGSLSPDHSWSFSITERTGPVVSFDSCSSLFDNTLSVINATSRIVISTIDDGGCGVDSVQAVLSLSLEVGQYMLVVEGAFQASNGRYTVSMNCTAQPPPIPQCNGVEDTELCQQYSSDNCSSVGGLPIVCPALCDNCPSTTTADIHTSTGSDDDGSGEESSTSIANSTSAITLSLTTVPPNDTSQTTFEQTTVTTGTDSTSQNQITLNATEDTLNATEDINSTVTQSMVSSIDTSPDSTSPVTTMSSSEAVVVQSTTAKSTVNQSTPLTTTRRPLPESVGEGDDESGLDTIQVIIIGIVVGLVIVLLAFVFSRKMTSKSEKNERMAASFPSNARSAISGPTAVGPLGDSSYVERGKVRDERERPAVRAQVPVIAPNDSDSETEYDDSDEEPVTTPQSARVVVIGNTSGETETDTPEPLPVHRDSQAIYTSSAVSNPVSRLDYSEPDQVGISPLNSDSVWVQRQGPGSGSDGKLWAEQLIRNASEQVPGLSSLESGLFTVLPHSDIPDGYILFLLVRGKMTEHLIRLKSARGTIINKQSYGQHDTFNDLVLALSSDPLPVDEHGRSWPLKLAAGIQESNGPTLVLSGSQSEKNKLAAAIGPNKSERQDEELQRQHEAERIKQQEEKARRDEEDRKEQESQRAREEEEQRQQQARKEREEEDRRQQETQAAQEAQQEEQRRQESSVSVAAVPQPDSGSDEEDDTVSVEYGNETLAVHYGSVQKMEGKKLGIGFNRADHGYMLVNFIKKDGLVKIQNKELAIAGRLLVSVNGTSTLNLEKDEVLDLMKSSDTLRLGLSDPPADADRMVSLVRQDSKRSRSSSTRSISSLAGSPPTHIPSPPADPAWFHRNKMSKEHAFEILQLPSNLIPGTFLIHAESPDPNSDRSLGNYCLCVVYQSKSGIKPTRHLLSRDDNNMILINQKKYGDFDTVDELVRQLSQEPLPPKWPVPLAVAAKIPAGFTHTAISRSPSTRSSIRSKASISSLERSGSVQSRGNEPPQWLHGPISKAEAAQLVTDTVGATGEVENGTFLVRERPDDSGRGLPDTYALCVFFRGRPTHHEIRFDHTAQVWLVNNKVFGNKSDFIEVVEQFYGPVNGWPCRFAVVVPVPPGGSGPQNWPPALVAPVPTPSADTAPSADRQEYLNVSGGGSDVAVVGGRSQWVHIAEDVSNGKEETKAWAIKKLRCEGQIHDDDNGKFVIKAVTGDESSRRFIMGLIFKKKLTMHAIEIDPVSGTGTVINKKHYGAFTSIDDMVSKLSVEPFPQGTVTWPVAGKLKVGLDANTNTLVPSAGTSSAPTSATSGGIKCGECGKQFQSETKDGDYDPSDNRWYCSSCWEDMEAE